MYPYIGEIKAFAFDFIPKGWLPCNGQLLSVSQNQALFSLLGTTYGGNGVNTFALPNLQGATMLHQNPSNPLGSFAGTETVSLNVSELPAHNHAMKAVNSLGLQPIGSAVNYLAQIDILNTATPPVRYAINGYASQVGSAVTLAPSTIASTGGGAPHENRMPYLTMTVCIATQGIFPSRN